jgi:membrane protein DedA with SNARE-associated domain
MFPQILPLRLSNRRGLTYIGMWLLFGWVLADQIGLPLPAMPALIGAGALARAGRMDLFSTIVAAAVASILGHAAWYEAGRRRGRGVLRLLCRVSLEPDACVRRGENLLAKNGTRTLILAHFIPGVDLVAQPLAALAGFSRGRYLAITVVGAVAWAAGFTGLGYLFGPSLLQVAHTVGTVLGGVLGVGFLAWLIWKIAIRYRLLAHLRTARLPPADLVRLLQADKVFVIDLRHPVDVAADPRRIATARHIPAEQLEQRLGEIPRDREIVLYCT